MVDLRPWRNPPDRPLGRTDLVLEDESSCTVLILDVICHCDDITVKLGSQTLAVIERRRFTNWLWHSGDLVVDDLALTVEGNTTFAVVNGDRQYVLMSGSVTKLAELIANSG